MQAREPEPERLHTEDLVLNIGDGVGALVLYTGPELLGREVEVSSVGQDAVRTHTVVRKRHVLGRVVCAGVFPELLAGDYRIQSGQPGRPVEFKIVSGQVTEVDWRL